MAAYSMGADDSVAADGADVHLRGAAEAPAARNHNPPDPTVLERLQSEYTEYTAAAAAAAVYVVGGSWFAFRAKGNCVCGGLQTH